MRKHLFALIMILVVASMALAACGGAAAEPVAAPQTGGDTAAPQTTVEEAPAAEMTDGMLPMVDPAAVSGDVVSAGSSTVFPLAEVMAERFEDEGFAGQITIDSIGSGAGYERFCVSGETDVANASRPIKNSEVEACAAIGRTPVEFRVGTDALAVTVSTENDFLTNVTKEELALIFSTAEKWSDVNPAYPAEDILRYIPGTDSGTFDYFVEEIFAKDEEPMLSASNTQLSEDDNVLVQGIEGSPYAIGFFGYAYYAENADKLNVLSIEGIEPSAESVDAATYPLARPLFLYSDASIMQEKPQVATYINFFLTYVNEEISQVGYFPADVTVGQQAWLDAMAADVSAAAPVEEMGMLPMVDPAAVSGDVVSAGSSTVFPLAEVMAERLQDEGFAGQITIDSIGSGAGYERFCVSGETDVANASRPIKDSEVEACAAIGRTPIEFRVGTDALAVTVSKENTFLTNATKEELALIFSTAEKWSDVNPAYPAEDILRYIPGTDSGTFDYFVEEIFAKDEEPMLSASNTQLSEDDNVLVQGIEGSPYAIGFFGYAYYAENADKLNVLSIEGIEPSAESVDAATYPLARPLFLYSDASIMQEKPQVATYINFFLTYVNEEISQVGYFPADVTVGQQAWLDAMGQ